MTEQRPEDNEQALTDSGVWVDESSSGLTHDPGVWVDPPAIDPDRLGTMIREQSGVTDLGNVQEPNLGGVPRPGLDPNSLYDEVYHEGEILDSVYGQVQGATPPSEGDQIIPTEPFDPSEYVTLNPQPLPPEPPPYLSSAHEQTIEGIDSLIQVTQMKSENANEEAIKDGLDLSSVYQEATPNNPVIDSVYGQTQGATPPKVEPSQYPPDLPSPSGGEELLPDGNANGIPGEYGDGPDLDANGVPDEIGINPDSLQPGYPNSPWASSLDPALFDPTEPGPTLDPSLFDPHLPGVTLDPALLDPTEPGPTLDPSQLDPSAPGPTLDPTQLEQGIVQPSGVSEPASVTDQGFTAPSLTEDPATAGQDDHEHDDFFEGGV